MHLLVWLHVTNLNNTESLEEVCRGWADRHGKMEEWTPQVWSMGGWMSTWVNEIVDRWMAEWTKEGMSNWTTAK